MVKIKVCGITNEADALAAVDLGTDALGFIFYRGSPRYVMPSVVREIVSLLPPFVTTVGVFVNEDIDKVNSIINFCRLTAVQLHGEEPPFYCEKLEARIIKAFRMKNAAVLQNLKNYKKVAAFLLDSYDEAQLGGTGGTFDLRLAIKAKEFDTPIIVSGGLSKSNIRKVIKRVKPYAVDVNSGVEISPGKKDYQKMAEFIKIVRSIK
jgi:phosphoribosylanthranilate isomerase